MNTQQTESSLVHLLLECVNIIENNNVIKKLRPVNHLEFFKHNFKQLYNDVNNLDILNESEDSFNDLLSSDWNKPDLQFVLKSNVYVKLKKMLRYINSMDATVITGLNESLKPVKKKVPFKYDINGFKMELNDVLDRLKNQDDLKHLPADILKIKTSLQSSLSVFGTDLYNIVDEIGARNPDMFAVVYNKSEHDLIIVSAQGGNVTFFEVYSITDDNFFNLVLSEKYKNCQNLFTYISPNVHNYLQILKDKIGHNLIVIYTDYNKLNLKFTDNIYKDRARIDAIENYKNQHLMSNSDVTNMINNVVM
jgi:hypothetical protein